jgi:hypothetical protein
MAPCLERSEVSTVTQESPNLDRHRTIIDACLRHQVPFFWRTPGTLLIAATGVVEVLRDLVAHGYRVLGYEGFDLDGAKVHPRLDLIYDAERRPDVVDPTEIVSGWPEDVWVDVALTRQ